MSTLKNFAENNLSLLLVLGCVVGFFAPGFGEWADEIVIFLTAVLIFLACADIKPTSFLKVDVFQMASFSLLRYAILPLVLFYGAHALFPQFSTGILLLALMPAGVSVAALCSMTRSNVALGLSLTILSSLLTPVLVSGVFSFLGHSIGVDVLMMFMTLVMVVLIPIVLYFSFIYKTKTVAPFIEKYNKASSVVILSLILVIVVATQKQNFLNNLDVVYVGLLVMVGLFAIFYLFGFAFSAFVPKDHRVPYIFASGAMNNSLAVGLAFAYFDANVVLFIVLSEIVFSIYIGVVQWGLSKKQAI